MRIILEIPTPPQEFARILDTIRRLDWFKEHGYSPTLPEDPIVEEIKASLDDPAKIKILEQKFWNELFSKNDYEMAYNQIAAQLKEMVPMKPVFKKLENAWGFKKIEEVKITMTLYGMGGSYDDKENHILLRVKKDGVINLQSVKRLIFHETVHIGIEENIVRKFSLTQNEKETIVDAICLSYIPGYSVQKRSIPALLQQLPIAKIEGDLPWTIQRYKLLSLGQEFIDLCGSLNISPIVYGSLACAAHLKDYSLPVNDIDFLVKEADFAKIIEAHSKIHCLRFEPTDYHSIKFYRGELKVAFDAIEHYLKDIKLETERTTINGYSFEILGLEPLKEAYRRAALSIPSKAEAYQGKLKLLESP